MHWVYATQSSKTGAIYVGETTRLYRRWNEHMRGRGGVTTSNDDYDRLIGLYSVGPNQIFMSHEKDLKEGRYNRWISSNWDTEGDKETACSLENHITRMYRSKYKHRNWWNIRGGKYCRHVGILDIDDLRMDRPFCKCGYPCEVKMKKDETKIYFVCPVPDWTAFEGITVPERCDFWEELVEYRILREKELADYISRRIEQNRQQRFARFIEETANDF